MPVVRRGGGLVQDAAELGGELALLGVVRGGRGPARVTGGRLSRVFGPLGLRVLGRGGRVQPRDLDRLGRLPRRLFALGALLPGGLGPRGAPAEALEGVLTDLPPERVVLRHTPTRADRGRPRQPSAARTSSISSSASVRGSRRRRPSWIRPTIGGSLARRRAASCSAVAGDRDRRAGQLEQRQRAAADLGGRLDDLAEAVVRGGVRGRGGWRRRRSTSSVRGSRPGRASRYRRSVASSAARESLSRRRARASGCCLAAWTAACVPTITPACGPPSSLSPEKQTSAAPALTERRTGGSSASDVRGPRRGCRSRRRRSPARRARTAPRSRPPGRSRAGGSSTGARGGSRRCAR